MRFEIVLPEVPVASLDAVAGERGGQGLAAGKRARPGGDDRRVGGAGLRGRGGAGFPIGTKWRSVRRAAGRHRYAVCNGAEGEPGTFKDRAILRANPYQVVEGLAIAALALEAPEVFIALEGQLRARARACDRGAVTEMEQAGLVGDLSIGIVAGPEEYLFGEEKALLEVIEGNDPLPRWLPPYVHGLFATAPQLGWQAHEPEAGHSCGHESNPTLGQQRRDAGQRARTSSRRAPTGIGRSARPSRRARSCAPSSATSSGRVSSRSRCGTPLREVLDDVRSAVDPVGRSGRCFPA